jgi:hypothetical protein
MVHLPAVNTPQFDWCKTAFSRHPRPVAPIYQPEVCAKAIIETALSGQRERVLGSWNKVLVAGSRLVPGLGDQFAARGAWDEQLSDRPVQPSRPCNLRAPSDNETDFGALGTFGNEAGGFFTPSFLASLPTAAREFAQAAAATCAERIRTALRRQSVQVRD